MSIDSDATKDLALTDEDAEGVVGGTKKKKVGHKSPAGHAGQNINVQFAVPPTAVTTSSEGDDCDPGLLARVSTLDPLDGNEGPMSRREFEAEWRREAVWIERDR